MQARRKSNISGVAVPKPMRSSTVYGLAENFRTVMTGPTSESGWTIAFTREPSGRRASTRGLVSSMRRPDGGDDPVDDPQHVLVVEEHAVDAVDLAGPLDVDLGGAVDHHLGDRLVLEERLQRPEARDLVDHLVDEAQPLFARHREALRHQDAVDDPLDLGR